MGRSAERDYFSSGPEITRRKFLELCAVAIGGATLGVVANKALEFLSNDTQQAEFPQQTKRDIQPQQRLLSPLDKAKP